MAERCQLLLLDKERLEGRTVVRRDRCFRSKRPRQRALEWLLATILSVLSCRTTASPWEGCLARFVACVRAMIWWVCVEA